MIVRTQGETQLASCYFSCWISFVCTVQHSSFTFTRTCTLHTMPTSSGPSPAKEPGLSQRNGSLNHGSNDLFRKQAGQAGGSSGPISYGPAPTQTQTLVDASAFTVPGDSSDHEMEEAAKRALDSGTTGETPGKKKGRKLESEFDEEAKKPTTNDDLMKMLIKMQASVTSVENTMATKTDMKLAISQAVDPLKCQLETVEGRMSKLELSQNGMKARMDGLGSSLKDLHSGGNLDGSGQNGMMSKEVQQMLNNLDPAFKRIAFIGFGSHINAAARVQALEQYMSQFPTFRYQSVDHFYKGNFNKRELSSVSYVEFSSDTAAKSFIDSLSSKSCTLVGTELKIKMSKSKINLKRDGSLKAAANLLKDSALGLGKAISINFKDRNITINGHQLAFIQEKGELKGTFTEAFSNLSLP